MNYQTITFTIQDGIGFLKLSTPPQNRMDLLFFDELENFVKKDLHTNNIKGLVVTSEGRHFSSGADTEELISEINGLNVDKKTFLEKNIETFSKLEKLEIPTVAAVQGCCFGSGLELALTCKFIVATKKSIFAMPESEFGLMPGCGGTLRFTERVGKTKSIELLISGRTFDAFEGLSIGVVDHISDKKYLAEDAKKLILKLSCSTLPL